MSDTRTRLSAALSGRYRIERELGAGGMATVYLAQDVRHARKVAIKVLKPELAAVLGAERFVQEIKTTAALSHPHILPLFDSGEADGFLYYVMPYIEGETIREKLNRETQLGIDEALRITTEVADALDYAHRHGVIHRDIKPENILLHDGRPMVMDFGIALAVSAAAGGRMTETGLSLGTPHYMSPEQATADKAITARSDVYSLASVLYEMLAGEPPHTGGSAQQIIMKIIAEPVPPVTALRKSVPPNVAAALAKALEKLPADRFDGAKAFADALANPAFVSSNGTRWAGSAAPSGASPRVTIALTGIALASIAVAAWALLKSPAVGEDAVVRATLDLPAGREVFAGGTVAATVAISPQGDRVAYVSNDSGGVRTYIRRTDELTGHAITGLPTTTSTDFAFSPDGRWLAFVSGNEIKKVLTDGGSPITVTNLDQVNVRGLAWLRSDTIVIGTLNGLRTIPASGGAIRLMPGSDSTKHAAYPVVLPDGKTLAFASGLNGSRKIALLAPGQAHFKELDVPALNPIGFREGRLLFVVNGGALMALPFDLNGQRVTGEAVQVESGFPNTNYGAAVVSLSSTGTLLYVTGASTSRLMLSVGNGTSVPLFDEVRSFSYPRFSPDGRKVAVSVTSGIGGGVGDIWVYDRDDHTFQRLTTDGASTTPEWSPDGRRILFRVQRPGKSEIWWQPADGSGKAEPLYQGVPANEAVMSPDGKWLVYRTAPIQEHFLDIFALPLTGDTMSRLLVGGPYRDSHPRLSPDGGWMAYQSNESGRFEVYVRPFPNAGSRTQVSVAGGGQPVWSRSGKELFYRTDEGIMSVGVTTGATFALHGRRLVLPGTIPEDLTHASYDVSPDGKFVSVMRAGGSVSLVLVHNWGRELRARLALGTRAP